MNNILSDSDRATLERAAELQALRSADQVRQWAGADNYDVASTLSSFVEAFGASQALLGDLAAIVRRLDDPADDPEEDPEDYNCAVCGALIGMFTGREGWHHYRGDGTPDNPVEIYDAGHQATPTGMLA